MLIMNRIVILFTVLSIALIFSCTKKEETVAEEQEVVTAKKLTLKEELGRRIFFDASLSTPEGQACSACHLPTGGWTGPDSNVNEKFAIYPGALKPRVGNRKPPTSAYAGFSPKLHMDEEETFIGGMFWDGRATGWTLDDPLAEQAMRPFINPLEMNMADKKSVILRIIKSDYADLFRQVWGADSLDAENDIDGTYERIASSIAIFERSFELTKFTSRFDDFWRKATSTGLDITSIDEKNIDQFKDMGLDEAELKGLVLFNTKGLCSQCHVLDSVDGNPPLLTDFTYDNLGVPRNPDNPFYMQDKQWNPDGKNWVDKGLGGFLETTKDYAQYAKENYGKHKVPTLRNVDLRPFEGFIKAFTHNGYFKTLKDVVSFYNTRDTDGAKWPPPEIAKNVNVDEMGDLGLTSEEEDLIVTFLKTLSDK